jgi:hypothetical protein
VKMNAAQRQDIETFLALDLEGLFAILDLVRSSSEHVLYAPGPEAKRGEATFNALRNQLHRRICVEWKFCEKRHDPSLADTVNLVAGIADVIASVTIGFPPVLIATILTKKGLSSFCDCSGATSDT